LRPVLERYLKANNSYYLITQFIFACRNNVIGSRKSFIFFASFNTKNVPI
jgi:hypothetical protein